MDELLRSKQTMVNALLKVDAEPALTEMSNDEILRMVALDIDKAVELSRSGGILRCR